MLPEATMLQLQQRQRRRHINEVICTFFQILLTTNSSVKLAGGGHSDSRNNPIPSEPIEFPVRAAVGETCDGRDRRITCLNPRPKAPHSKQKLSSAQIALGCVASALIEPTPEQVLATREAQKRAKVKGSGLLSCSFSFCKVCTRNQFHCPAKPGIPF